jgi:hypothetical protein
MDVMWMCHVPSRAAVISRLDEIDAISFLSRQIAFSSRAKLLVIRKRSGTHVRSEIS